jgi:adenylyltransferase/sulfurtransferase
MTILPGQTACLRCLLVDCPVPGSVPTCDTAGILGSIVGVIAALETAEAIKILSGNRDAVSHALTVVDLWQNHLRRIDLKDLRDRVDCPTCRRGQFPWLSGCAGSRSAILCGRNAVQLSHPDTSISLDELARQLQGIGHLTRNPFLLRLKVENYELTVFPDGRSIISGTNDITTARAVYAKYVSH